jgi:hypothetical protein
MSRSLRFLAAAAAAVVLAACASAAKPAAGAQNAVPTATQTAVANAIDALNAPFVASAKSKKFYPAACSTVKLIKPADRVGFASMKDAEAAGFAKDAYSTDCRY